MIEFENFDLKIEGNTAEEYTIEAVGPAGERATAPFHGAALTALSDDLAAIRDGVADGATLERVGTALFQALFPLEVLMVYVQVQAGLGAKGLRLRLHLPPDLAPMPWELLYYPPHYLALDPRRPVVRFLDLPDTPRPLAVRPPLRLLHLVAAPVDLPPLDVAGEAARLQEALVPLAGQVEIVPAEAGTLAALRRGLRQGCHLLHFSGHGGFAGEGGYLFFEAEDGRSQRVDGDLLAHLLRGSDVRLALLNACQSAQVEAGDAFGSVAAALVRAGLPAVVAHQQAMPDDSAVAFAAEFYRALADGYPVDAAVGEGRKAVLSTLGADWRARPDWAIPVLLMRARDGRILTVERGAAAGSASPPAVYTARPMTVVDVDSISGGQVNFDMRIGAPGAGAPAAPAPPGPADEIPFDVARIRRLLLHAFTPADLRRFCQDRPLFRPIIARFGPGQGLDDMVAEVIDFCATRFLWADLLAAVQAENPRQYDRFAPYGPQPPPPADPLPDLLAELRRVVRQQAPPEQVGPALEKVAALRGAATAPRPDLAVLESVWRWFDAQLPALSGAVLSVILQLEPRLEALEDDALWLEFQQRFRDHDL